MSRILRALAGFAAAVSLAAPVWAGDAGRLPPPVLQNVHIRSETEFDAAAGIYTYTYAVSNPATNTGEIWLIYIDISMPPDGLELGSEGFTIPIGNTLYSFDEEAASLADLEWYIPMVPVGIMLPPGWEGSITAGGSAGVGSAAEERGGRHLFPGETVTGLKLVSYGLPTVRGIKVEPWWIYVQSEDLSDEEAEEEDKRAIEVEASIVFRTFTIGPTAPPLDSEPIAFIDYIIEMKHEAASLGWITERGIINSLDAKLENARKAIERGSLTSAKNVIEAFINEVEAQGCETYDACPEGRHLTPEAYALLKYNAMYLSDRL